MKNIPLTLSGVKSKVKILDFWSSNGAPYQQEMPKLQDLYNTYKSQGIEIIVIPLDKDKKATEKLKKMKVNQD